MEKASTVQFQSTQGHFLPICLLLKFQVRWSSLILATPSLEVSWRLLLYEDWKCWSSSWELIFNRALQCSAWKKSLKTISKTWLPLLVWSLFPFLYDRLHSNQVYDYLLRSVFGIGVYGISNYYCCTDLSIQLNRSFIKITYLSETSRTSQESISTQLQESGSSNLLIYALIFMYLTFTI